MQKTTARTSQSEVEKRNLEKQLAIEHRKKVGFTYMEIISYLEYIRSLSDKNRVKQKVLIYIFVNRICSTQNCRSCERQFFVYSASIDAY